ncbi:hypothetical protein [Clostridium beijerinckii]|nr:hypothetical protein [Clostridium beijerinckii]NOW06115.1 hypothetical protein [Clostridium beijerinckii]
MKLVANRILALGEEQWHELLKAQQLGQKRRLCWVWRLQYSRLCR